TGAWSAAKKERVFNAFMKYSSVPIINMESNLYHPCQALADVMTMQESSSGLAGRKVLLTWAYHPKALPTATANSFALLTSRYGADLTILRPEGFDLDPMIQQMIEKNVHESGGTLTVTSDVEKGYTGADFVYAKSWGSLRYYGNWEAEKPIREKLRDWQVTPEKMDLTNKGRFMHCLPVRRNIVVADNVIDDPGSLVIRQAENRLHAQKGLLTYLLQE
ncbi:MAG: N-acetylornithine carbamoyltransferase, partial [Candidatus Ranarchaeia archaeon]